VGVCWNKKNRKWRAEIGQDGKRQRLGYFDDEREAARAFDTVVRRLRGEDAHGGRAGRNWLRLNFPSKWEAARAKALGMPAVALKPSSVLGRLYCGNYDGSTAVLMTCTKSGTNQNRPKFLDDRRKSPFSFRLYTPDLNTYCRSKKFIDASGQATNS
jgi:hypothetical protein